MAFTEDVVNVVNQAVGALKSMRAVSLNDSGGNAKTQQVVSIGDPTTGANVQAVKNTVPLVADFAAVVAVRPPSTAAVAAATASTVKNSAGTLYGVCVTTVGTAAINFYDNTAASGTIILTIAANQAVGFVPFPSLGVGFVTGCYAGGGTNTPAVTVVYS